MFIRLEPQGGYLGGRRQYEGVCEAESDITAAQTAGYAAYDGAHIEMAAGSLILCLENNALYVQVSNGTWQKIGEDEEEEEVGT